MSTSLGEVVHEKKADVEVLDPLLEVNESETFECPLENFEFTEIPPKIFTLKDVKEPLTCESLKNALYEVGVVSLCWPEIEEPVFESRTCFPESYYTNNNKERLLLAYAENFRRQYNLFYKKTLPLLFQAPNEIGLQKMVCTSIRPTKICFPNTNTWQGLASLVADFFNYEPLHKPMLHSIWSIHLRPLHVWYIPPQVTKLDRNESQYGAVAGGATESEDPRRVTTSVPEVKGAGYGANWIGVRAAGGGRQAGAGSGHGAVAGSGHGAVASGDHGAGMTSGHVVGTSGHEVRTSGSFVTGTSTMQNSPTPDDWSTNEMENPAVFEETSRCTACVMVDNKGRNCRTNANNLEAQRGRRRLFPAPVEKYITN